ncbi:unnamed protein product, partial [Candidula unifasciata]
LNKRRTLTQSSCSRTSSVEQTNSEVGQGNIHRNNSGGGAGFSAVGNRSCELFPSPNSGSSLMSARGGPDLGSLSGHW